MFNLPQQILIADDDDDYHFIFEQALRDAGIQANLNKASNGLEVLDLLDILSPLPDFLFMDINMPKMDGLSTLTLIRQKENCKHLPIIIISTTEEYTTVEKAYVLGANLYLCKPERYSDYVEMLSTIFKNRNIREEQNTFIRLKTK